MAFWIKRVQGTPFLISDLGQIVDATSEMDLEEQVTLTAILESADLPTAFGASNLERIVGPGGATVPPGEEFGNVASDHDMDAPSHTGGTQGDLVFKGASGWETLPAGSVNQILATQGVADPAWADVSTLLPARNFNVALSGGDYTSIKAAVDAAVTAGASVSTPYQITVFPGNYVEDPMTIIPGIVLTTQAGNRADTVMVTPNNPAEDLFTCTGGYIEGIHARGVSDPVKAIFRMVTANSLTVMHGVSLCLCSTGIAIGGGASVVMTDFSININAPGQSVTTGIELTGASSYLAINGGFLSVPSVLLPAYGDNPVQTGISITTGRAYLVGVALKLAPKPGAAVVSNVIMLDDGAFVSVMACEASGNGHVINIGATGSNTHAVVSAVSFDNNILNLKVDSATGSVFANFSTDGEPFELVPGARRSGMIQFRDDDRTKLFGDVRYQYPSNKQVHLDDYLEDYNGTGIAEGCLVTDAGGLTVDVALGDGWVRRASASPPDAFTVHIAAEAGVVLVASTTNYVYFDSVTEVIVVAGAAPGEAGILLATVVTDGTGIRFLHNTRSVTDGTVDRMHNYLIETRKRALRSGLAVSAGSTGLKFDVGSGSYYIALNVLPYAGAVDATFSYFYGTNGVNEVPGLTDVSNSQYDNAGTLTALTAGYFRTDTVVLSSDGRVSVIYGTAEYATKLIATAAGSALVPTFIEPTSFPVANLVVEDGASIVEIIDTRTVPAVGSGGGGGGGVTAHGALSGLGNDDHTQYLLTTGARPLTGTLDLGANAIINVGNVDGVDVSAHVVRHQPGGVDAISTNVPVATQIGTSPAEGASTDLARSDHQHGVTAAVPTDVGTANAAGAASTGARSDHVHAGLTRGAADFAVFTPKATPATTDVLLIEDSGDASAKKRITIGDFPSLVDDTAIHKAVAGEIAAMTEKVTPVDGDWVVLEDSEAADAKKKVQLTNLLVDVGGIVRQATMVVVPGDITTTAGAPGAYSDLLTVNLTTGVGFIQILFTGCAEASNGTASLFYGLTMDGDTNWLVQGAVRVSSSNQPQPMSLNYYAPVTAGAHIIKVRWGLSSGTARMLVATKPAEEHGEIIVTEFR